MAASPTSNTFARFVAASRLTNLADGVATVVWAWVVTLLTRDPLLVALMPLAFRLPWFLFALPAGLVADRVGRRALILAMDIARAAAFTLAAVSVFVAAPLPPAAEEGVALSWLFALVLVSAFGVGTAEVFRDNAAQTVLPSIVPHDRLERANGRFWSVEIVGNELLGPALGAFLIAASVWSPFAINAAAFGCAVLLLMSLPGNFKPPERARENWREELGEGLAFLKGSRILTVLALVTGVWNLLWMMITVALILHAQENLGLFAPEYGLLLAVGAVGGIIGSFIGEHVIARLGQGRTTQLMLLASAVTFALIPLSPNGWLLALILFAFQPTGVVWNTVSVSYRQRVTPPELLGRVNSIYRLLAWGMMPIGLLLSGWLIKVGETALSRETALILPFIFTAIAAALLTIASWRALGRGFAQKESSGTKAYG